MNTERWAIYDTDLDVWIVDTCAGGVVDTDIKNAVEFASREEAREAIQAADLDEKPLVIIRIK